MMKPFKPTLFVILFALFFPSISPAFTQTPPNKETVKEEVVNVTSIEELLPAEETVMLAITSDLSGLVTSFRNLDGLQVLKQREPATENKKNVIAERLNEAELFLSSGIKNSKVMDSARLGIAVLMPPMPKDLDALDEKTKAEKIKSADISNATPIILIETPNLEFAQQARQEFIEFHQEYFAELKETETDKNFQIKIDRFENGSYGALLGTTYVLCSQSSMQALMTNYRNRTIEKLADDAQYNQAKAGSVAGAGLFVYLNGKAISSALAKVTDLGIGSGMTNFLLPALSSIKMATLSSTFESKGVIDRLNFELAEGEENSFEGLMGGANSESKSLRYLPKGTNVYVAHSLDWGNFLDKLIFPTLIGFDLMSQNDAKIRAKREEFSARKKSEKDELTEAQTAELDADREEFQKEMLTLKGAKLEAARKKYVTQLDRELGINLRDEIVRVVGGEVVIAYDFIKKPQVEVAAVADDSDDDNKQVVEVPVPMRSSGGMFGASLAAMIAVKDKNGAKALLLKLVAYVSGNIGSMLGAVPKSNTVQIPPDQKSDEQLKQEREQREAGINMAYSMLPKETYKNAELLSIGPFCIGLNDDFLFLSESKETVKKMIDTRDSDESLLADADFNAAMTRVSSAGMTRLYVSRGYFETMGSVLLRDYFSPLDFAPLDENQPSPYGFPATIAANAEIDKKRIKLEMFSPVGIGGAFLLSYFGSTIKGKAEANEGNARMVLRALAKAEAAHAKKFKTGYAEAAVVLKNRRAGIGAEIFTQEQENYRFKFVLKPNKKGYEATATPVKYGRNGRLSFFINESDDLRATDKKGETATVADPLDDTPDYAEVAAEAAAAAASAAEETAPKPRPRRKKK